MKTIKKLEKEMKFGRTPLKEVQLQTRKEDFEFIDRCHTEIAREGGIHTRVLNKGWVLKKLFKLKQRIGG